MLGDATDDAVLTRRAATEPRARRRARQRRRQLVRDPERPGAAAGPVHRGPGPLEESDEKLRRAGADRVVNPQSIGGARMAAFVLQPHVTEFLDVVMHDRGIEFRLEEVPVARGVADRRDAAPRRTPPRPHRRARPGAARRNGTFTTNPPPETEIHAGQVIIAIGTPGDLEKLQRLVTSTLSVGPH